MKRMNHFISCSLVIYLSFFISPLLYVQQDLLPDLDANFAALIVRDLDTSLQWYQQLFGYVLIDQIDRPQIGLRQANLKIGGNHLELIQLASAVDPITLLAKESSSSRFVGFFKFGYKVGEFDHWLEKLQSLGHQTDDQVVADPLSGKRMIVFRDPDGNRIQLFEE